MSDVIVMHDLVKTYGAARSRGRRRTRGGSVEAVGAATAPVGGRTRALDGLDLTVRRGEVFGFLGPNGAGKTTAIRLLLDLLRPTSGTVRVFGVDPRVAGTAGRRRLGYLPGDVRIGAQQTARELLMHLAHLRGGVPSGRIDALAERLALDLDLVIRTLSKGNRQKVGLIQAFMHEPELLILDEPTSGLDPLFQREFLSMVREAAASGRTVFMSSHVLSEVQQVADRAGIIRDGRLVAVESVEVLRERAIRRIEVHFAHDVAADAFAGVAGLEEVRIEGRVLRAHLSGNADALVKAAARHEVVSFVAAESDLEALFFTYYAREGERHAA
jgi:ABC-2 type transport system ATP-binding protein